MLKTVEIDGFRSLLDFKMSLEPGLNVIVGANGSGKSNFIGFLDFLGVLVEGDLNAAVAVAQGAGSLFSRERFSSRENAELAFKLDGEFDFQSVRGADLFDSNDGSASSTSRAYSYKCTISYLASVPAVFISSETITISPRGENEITIARFTTHGEEGFRTRVTLYPAEHKLNRTIFRYLRRNDATVDIGEYLAERVTPERTVLWWIARETAEFEYITNDLARYRSVNIDPAAARKSTPVGTVATLRSNGEGLAGALYQLKAGNYLPRNIYGRYVRRPRVGKAVFESIISWCREVNPCIEDVQIELDVMEAQLRPFMQFRHGLAPERFSFRRISDGTVKWLALTTVLFAEPELSVIEEPENFLHPFMQESFVALCRQALQREPGRTILISTHSPTLLDCCRPPELTLFELVEGKTTASRIANGAELAKKIENSRFGLGYYYRIGSLYGENSSDS